MTFKKFQKSIIISDYAQKKKRKRKKAMQIRILKGNNPQLVIEVKVTVYKTTNYTRETKINNYEWKSGKIKWTITKERERRDILSRAVKSEKKRVLWKGIILHLFYAFVFNFGEEQSSVFCLLLIICGVVI